ncbi:glycine--tRNA ligase subunit beta [Pasteuria penetrans]|uniref:glycine--tRNA ligase subunit beta n=1 Tax=Pasteuria penetrans TaxID=86005 RepID=UPI000FAB066C|nr:glycine--tRNA ligase subunit beta [Pasteuria penetrans]
MRKEDLLLEIGCEEIPARFLLSLEQQLRTAVETFLEGSEISYKDAKSYSTPRRLAVRVEQVAISQGQSWEEVRGPSLSLAQNAQGEWTKQALGFARKQGICSEDLSVREVGGDLYVFSKVKRGGRSTEDCLLEGIPRILQNLSLPNSMRFGPPGVRFIRPVRWLLLLHGDRVLPFCWAGLRAHNTTRGHRFLGRVIEVHHPSSYVQQLREQCVLVDRVERRQRIVSQLRELEERENLIVDAPTDLLEEVTDLLEFPTSFIGALPPSSMDLPDDVLLTTMRVHQRYFSVRDKEGKIQPFFVAVRNGNMESIETVASGNERVIAARLADARFFYEMDRRKNPQDFVGQLDRIVNHEQLGSVGQRVRRLHAMASTLGPRYGLTSTEQQWLERATILSKFDLATMMVQEFPELEGTIGAHYACKTGEPVAVVEAIGEHLLPRHADDRLPGSKLGILLALLDKMEMVTSYFAVGIRPTGSQDPHGLRRRAQAIMTILLDPVWSGVGLGDFWELTLDLLREEDLISSSCSSILEALREFFALRMVSILEKSDVPTDTCMALRAGSTDVPHLVLAKGRVLERVRYRSSFRSEVEAYTRAARLAKRARPGGEIRIPLLWEPAEVDLYHTFQVAEESFLRAQQSGDAYGMYCAFTSVMPMIHRFFAEVLVMVEDQGIRENRLTLLRTIADRILTFADLSQLILPPQGERDSISQEGTREEGTMGKEG